MSFEIYILVFEALLIYLSWEFVGVASFPISGLCLVTGLINIAFWQCCLTLDRRMRSHWQQFRWACAYSRLTARTHAQCRESGEGRVSAVHWLCRSLSCVAAVVWCVCVRVLVIWRVTRDGPCSSTRYAHSLPFDGDCSRKNCSLGIFFFIFNICELLFCSITRFCVVWSF